MIKKKLINYHFLLLLALFLLFLPHQHASFFQEIVSPFLRYFYLMKNDNQAIDHIIAGSFLGGGDIPPQSIITKLNAGVGQSNIVKKIIFTTIKISFFPVINFPGHMINLFSTLLQTTSTGLQFIEEMLYVIRTNKIPKIKGIVANVGFNLFAKSDKNVDTKLRSILGTQWEVNEEKEIEIPSQSMAKESNNNTASKEINLVVSDVINNHTKQKKDTKTINLEKRLYNEYNLLIEKVSAEQQNQKNFTYKKSITFAKNYQEEAFDNLNKSDAKYELDTLIIKFITKNIINIVSGEYSMRKEASAQTQKLPADIATSSTKSALQNQEIQKEKEAAEAENLLAKRLLADFSQSSLLLDHCISTTDGSFDKSVYLLYKAFFPTPFAFLGQMCLFPLEKMLLIAGGITKKTGEIFKYSAKIYNNFSSWIGKNIIFPIFCSFGSYPQTNISSLLTAALVVAAVLRWTSNKKNLSERVWNICENSASFMESFKLFSGSIYCIDIGASGYFKFLSFGKKYLSLSKKFLHTLHQDTIHPSIEMALRYNNALQKKIKNSYSTIITSAEKARQDNNNFHWTLHTAQRFFCFDIPLALIGTPGRLCSFTKMTGKKLKRPFTLVIKSPGVQLFFWTTMGFNALYCTTERLTLDAQAFFDYKKEESKKSFAKEKEKYLESLKKFLGISEASGKLLYQQMVDTDKAKAIMEGITEKFAKFEAKFENLENNDELAVEKDGKEDFKDAIVKDDDLVVVQEKKDIEFNNLNSENYRGKNLQAQLLQDLEKRLQNIYNEKNTLSMYTESVENMIKNEQLKFAPEYYHYSKIRIDRDQTRVIFSHIFSDLTTITEKLKAYDFKGAELSRSIGFYGNYDDVNRLDEFAIAYLPSLPDQNARGAFLKVIRDTELQIQKSIMGLLAGGLSKIQLLHDTLLEEIKRLNLEQVAKNAKSEQERKNQLLSQSMIASTEKEQLQIKTEEIADEIPFQDVPQQELKQSTSVKDLQKLTNSFDSAIDNSSKRRNSLTLINDQHNVELSIIRSKLGYKEDA